MCIYSRTRQVLVRPFARAAARCSVVVVVASDVAHPLAYESINASADLSVHTRGRQLGTT